MWKNLIHQHQAKPISASSMLRENNWVVRDNKGFSNASNLESLSSQMLVLAKRYDPKKKGKPATLKDIAIAEIDSVSLDEGGVAYLKIRMHVKQRDDAKKLEDINAVMRSCPFILTTTGESESHFLRVFVKSSVNAHSPA